MESCFDMLVPASKISDVPEKVIAKYEMSLPKELVSEWETRGFCNYLGGLIKTVNPEEYYDMISDWDDEPELCSVILITAFGDFYFVKQGNIYAQAVHQKLRTNLQNNLRLIIKFSFSTKQYQENVFHKTLYLKCLKTLQKPDASEIYAFTPAIALGGQYSINYATKVNLKEHLSILSQL